MSSFDSNSSVLMSDKYSLSNRAMNKKLDFKDSCLSFDGPVKMSDNYSGNGVS